MKILCAFGEYNYGRLERGKGYEFSNFLPALEALGHEVVFFETLDRDRYLDFADMNRQFLETVQSEKPDIIFCILMLYELWLETLQIARGICDSALIVWGTDDSWQYRQFARLIAPYCDLYATTDCKAFEKAHLEDLDNFYLTQWAASGAKLQEPLPARECSYQVSFVGSRYGNRVARIDGLRQRGIDVACFGHGWENGSVSAEDVPRIMRNSVISLNFGDSGIVVDGFSVSRSRQIKARIFEVPGCGGFLMTESAADLERYYISGREVVTFDGMDDLAEKIRYYLAHPDERDRIARKGHERTRSEHTYEMRFARLLEAAALKKETALAIGEKAHKKKLQRLEGFQELVERHRLNVGLRFLRILLTEPCILLWGKQRGPRAARRMLFELSWRLFGAKTYSASGWPGRMFYRES